MTFIRKTRREWFGGIVYSENPGFTAYVDTRRADSLGIPRRDDLTEGLFSAPLDVHMSITNRCSLNCRGCYARTDSEALKDMPLDLARGIIDRLADMDVFTIALGGGEPFLHPRLFEITQYARDRGLVPNITTNGLHIDRRMAERCQVFGSIHLSCHNVSELTCLEEAACLLRKTGVDIGLNVLVSTETYPGLAAIWAWCAEQGISRILLLKFKLTGKNRDSRDMALSPSQEQALVPLMRRLARKHPVMPMLDCSFFPALAWHRPKRKDIEFFDVNGCVGANAILAVTVDGRFKPCSFWPAPFGDALALDRNTWSEDPDLSEFRRSRLCNACSGCTYGDLCNGGCPVAVTPWCLAEAVSGQSHAHH